MYFSWSDKGLVYPRLPESGMARSSDAMEAPDVLPELGVKGSA